MAQSHETNARRRCRRTSSVAAGDSTGTFAGTLVSFSPLSKPRAGLMMMHDATKATATAFIGDILAQKWRPEPAFGGGGYLGSQNTETLTPTPRGRPKRERNWKHVQSLHAIRTRGTGRVLRYIVMLLLH